MLKTNPVLWVLCFAIPFLMARTSCALSDMTGAVLERDCKAAIVSLDNPSAAFDIAMAGHAASCSAYMQAFLDGTTLWKAVAKRRGSNAYPGLCVPAKVTMEELVREIPVWLLRHPEDRKENAWVVLTAMIHERYPCP